MSTPRGVGYTDDARDTETPERNKGMTFQARASRAAVAIAALGGLAILAVVAAPSFAGADSVDGRPSHAHTKAIPGMARMHEQMMSGNPGMARMHERMHVP